MAEKDEPGGEASFLDQFLRRLDQTDHEAAASPSTSGTTMASSETYSSAATNPWSFMSTASPLNPATSPYMSLPANPLAEFPWLLEEFDQQNAQRLYSPYEPGQVLEPSPSSEPTSSSRDQAAGPVPRFGEPGSPVVPKHINYVRPPTSPLLSEATAAAVGAGSVTTSAGTSNTSVSSESTSNAGDEDESEVKKEAATEGASSGKRKKPEQEGDTPGSSKKSDQPKNKPRKRGLAKRLREPRYAIKTRTDVDVLDDGFKWRKYGQKAVKNSPHPRNYYRCTTPQCPVRKRVERSNEDSGLVITTYEGTHTHQTPGFHRPSAAGGYYGDRPLGMGGGLFQSPLGPGSTLLPLPPGFDLASLQQATALRNSSIRGLQPPNQNLLPGSSSGQQFRGVQQGSLFRAQQFLGLQDGGSTAFVKQEPFQFSAQDFISRNLASLPALPNQMLNRSSPLFSGLNFPDLQPPSGSLSISRPASSSNTSSGQQQGRHELHPGAGSSGIDQSLETLVSSSSGHPNYSDHAQGAEQARGRAPSVQQHQQQQQQQQQQQRSIRSAGASAAGGFSSAVSSENLQGESETGAREGLLQDMVRRPKVSKS